MSQIHSSEKSYESLTIFTTHPLIIHESKNSLIHAYIPYIQKAALPFTAGLCCYIKKENLLSDIIKNPWTTSILLYCTMQYTYYLFQQYQQDIIDNEIAHVLQEIFYLLVIGHGLHNTITYRQQIQPTFTGLIDIHCTPLELFLQKTYEIWQSLFLYYTSRHKNKILFAYNTDQIEYFEVLQASSCDHDLLNLIINFYQQNYYPCDYQTILSKLEQKFKIYSHKLLHLNLDKNN